MRLVLTRLEFIARGTSEVSINMLKLTRMWVLKGDARVPSRFLCTQALRRLDGCEEGWSLPGTRGMQGSH